MKVIRLIASIVLIIFGLGTSAGTLIGLIDGTSEYSLATDLIGLVIAGIAPIVIGGFLCWWALSRQSEQVLASDNRVADSKEQ